MAMADKGRCPFGSGARTSQPDSPGPPSPPSPSPIAMGEGEKTDPGEGQALPRTPGLPLRGGFRTETLPCPMAMGEEAEG